MHKRLIVDDSATMRKIIMKSLSAAIGACEFVFVRCVRDQKARQAVDVDDKKLIKMVSDTTPIIMITTEGSLEKVQEALAAGANDYLKKPFTPDQLNEKLGPFLS